MTRKLFVLPVALITAAAMAGTASAGSGHEFATGGGETGLGTQFGFAAQNTNSGTSGHAVFKSETAPERKGKVICLQVTGNRAVFGIEMDNAAPGARYTSFEVIDNGEPRGGVPVDTIRGSAFTDVQPTCDGTLSATRVVSRGNVNVRE